MLFIVFFTLRVRCLQINFGTLDFQHLYDLYRWRFFKNSFGVKSLYWSDMVQIVASHYRVRMSLRIGIFMVVYVAHFLMLYIIIVD